ncbi:MAG: TerB family tellurite resistance protein [Chitinophagales bacterium]|nr:TerB family tellurite resistance protein [Chitinophagales bacterium]
MAKYAKWIVGALGAAIVGPIGALVGFAIGALLDNAESREIMTDQRTGTTYQPDGFSAALLVLTAAVMKADGRIVKAELDFVKEFFKSQFGVEKTKKDMLLLREILEKDISIFQIATQIQHGTDHATRLQLMHYLMGIAHADGQIDESELRVLRSISNYFKINSYDFESIRAMFGKNTLKDAYAILEIDDSANHEDIKKAYKKMAAKFHPDRVSHLGEEHAKAAEDKFKKVQDAYELVKKAKGIS